MISHLDIFLVLQERKGNYKESTVERLASSTLDLSSFEPFDQKTGK